MRKYSGNMRGTGEGIVVCSQCGGWLDPPGCDTNNQCGKRDKYWDEVVRFRRVASWCSSMQRLLINFEDRGAILLL